MTTTAERKDEMKSLAECINHLLKAGFDKQFKVIPKGLQELSSEKIYSPEQIKILNFYRFEGESDPADNSILYAIEADDGIRGTLVDAFGPYADSKVTGFIKRVEDIQKKIHEKEIIGQ